MVLQKGNWLGIVEMDRNDGQVERRIFHESSKKEKGERKDPECPKPWRKLQIDQREENRERKRLL